MKKGKNRKKKEMMDNVAGCVCEERLFGSKERLWEHKKYYSE